LLIGLKKQMLTKIAWHMTCKCVFKQVLQMWLIMTRVLVTGGAGFIGSHLVDRLIDEGYDVRVIDSLYSGKLENIEHHIKSGKVDFVKGDIRDASLVKKSLIGVEAVFHLAAIISVPFSVSNPELTLDVNLAGTLNLLNACSEKNVGKFIFVSSCAVFGDTNENASTNPISPYAESKLLAERDCLNFQQKGLLQSVVLRFFNVYGPRQGMNDYSGVITRFINRAKEGQSLTIYGDGSQTRDFVNVKDIVQALFTCLKISGANGEVFNIGSGKATSITELAKAVLELTGQDLEIRYELIRAGDIKDSFADISKARKLLAYEPEVSLRDGLRVLI
jgi:UDP-glucose 4-epimerase